MTHEILICMECGKADYPDDINPHAITLKDTLAKRLGADDVHVREVGCMSQCSEHEVVAFKGAGRETLLFTNIDVEENMEGLIETFQIYRAYPPAEKLKKGKMAGGFGRRLKARIPF